MCPIRALPELHLSDRVGVSVRSFPAIIFPSIIRFELFAVFGRMAAVFRVNHSFVIRNGIDRTHRWR